MNSSSRITKTSNIIKKVMIDQLYTNPYGAGILPYTFNKNGTLLFCVGSEMRGLSDFGGLSEGNEKDFQAAAREFSEETLGSFSLNADDRGRLEGVESSRVMFERVLKSDEHRDRLVKRITNINKGYVMFITPVPHIVSSEEFYTSWFYNNEIRFYNKRINDADKREIKWLTLDELLEGAKTMVDAALTSTHVIATATESEIITKSSGKSFNITYDYHLVDYWAKKNTKQHYEKFWRINKNYRTILIDQNDINNSNNNNSSNNITFYKGKSFHIPFSHSILNENCQSFLYGLSNLNPITTMNEINKLFNKS